jgi:hypothetical protein
MTLLAELQLRNALKALLDHIHDYNDRQLFILEVLAIK